VVVKTGILVRTKILPPDRVIIIPLARSMLLSAETKLKISTLLTTVLGTGVSKSDGSPMRLNPEPSADFSSAMSSSNGSAGEADINRGGGAGTRARSGSGLGCLGVLVGGVERAKRQADGEGEDADWVKGHRGWSCKRTVGGRSSNEKAAGGEAGGLLENGRRFGC